MSRLLLSFYGDDFTGSTDALEQLTNFGIRTMLFIEPPTSQQLVRFKHLDAIGVAGMTRSKTAEALEKELVPALQKLKALGAPHVHYKVCSTFDSSPKIGSIGRVIDVAAGIFDAPFVPLLVAAPALGRYCVFGNLFARFGIGSDGEIHRLDRHPSVSRHPVTPMTEADLRVHLGKQTKKTIALFDILNVARPETEAHTALKAVLAAKPDAVLFDALHPDQMKIIGSLMEAYASRRCPLFSVGSSGIEMALGAHWEKRCSPKRFASPAEQVLIGSGSCSPVTRRQISWATKNGFAEVALRTAALASPRRCEKEIQGATEAVGTRLRRGYSVIVHTTRALDKRVAATAKSRCNAARVLGSALGRILREALGESNVRRVCVAGGDTSSYAARALGIEALETIASLTPGAPLCRAVAPNSPADGCEIVFKGGQVGAENYFGIVRDGTKEQGRRDACPTFR